MNKIINIEQIYNNDNKLIREYKTEKNVYEYNELSDKAKEKAKNIMYIDKINDDIYNELFKEYLDEQLEELFPNSDIKYQYSLNNCQGDGFNLYGELNLYDVLDKIKDNFTDKELKFINWVLKDIADTYKLECNNRYEYCICDKANVLENATNWMEMYWYKNIDYKTVEKFESYVSEYLCKLCSKFEKEGYDFLYEFNDGDIECYEDNGYMFYQDGTMIKIAI